MIWRKVQSFPLSDAVNICRERYLPLVLFAYRTATHAATGDSPFMNIDVWKTAQVLL